jgi:hypothetical protein
MVHLKQFFNKQIIPLLRIGIFLSLAILQLETLSASSLSIFNPTDKTDKYNFLLDSSINNDFISFKELLKKWERDYNPKKGTNIAILNSRLDMGINLYDFYFGYAFRYDSFIQTDKSTTDLLELIKTKQDLPLNKKYKVDVEIYAIQTQSFILSKEIKWVNNNYQKLNLYLGFSILQASMGQNGKVQADADIVSKKDYDFIGESDYYYTFNHLYNLDIVKPKGYGYSLNFALSYKNNKHSFLLLGEDIASKINWKDMPYSQISITSDTKKYDENGYVYYNPTITGYEQYRNYTQNLKAKYYFEYKYDYGKKIKTKIGAELYQGFLLPFGAIEYQKYDDTKYIFGYDIRFKKISIGLNIDNFSLIVSTNGIYKPSAVDIALSYSF